MIQIDIRFNPDETNMLRSLIGEKLESIQHDPFLFVNSSSQALQINAECGTYYLYSFTEPLDYYGTTEDVAVWTFESERYKAVDNKAFITTPVQAVIKNITLVQENQRLFRGETQIYDVWLTRGIIVDFGDYQLAFEKAVWFSEDIYVHKGYDLTKKFASVDNFINSDWSNGLRAECSRKTESLQQ